MLITTNSFMDYLFNFLFVYMIVFVGALVSDIFDTIKNQTEIKIFSSAVNSLFCTMILVVIYDIWKLSSSVIITISIIVGIRSHGIANFIAKVCKGDRLIKIVCGLIINDEDTRNYIISVLLDQKDKNEDDN